jgi:hypothetical protein
MAILSKFDTGKREQEIGNRKNGLNPGNWKLETGDWSRIIS